MQQWLSDYTRTPPHMVEDEFNHEIVVSEFELGHLEGKPVVDLIRNLSEVQKSVPPDAPVLRFRILKAKGTLRLYYMVPWTEEEINKFKDQIKFEKK